MALPAPYAPPWKRLGEDLVATLAWLGLKLREVWRRNGEGSLPVPRFWPRQWPQLFWPLVVGAALLAALALGRPMLRFHRSPVLQEPAAVIESQPTPAAALSPAASEPSLTPQNRPAPLEDGPLNGEERNEPASPAELETETREPLAETPDLADTPALDSDLDGAPPLAAPTEAELLRAEWGAEDPEQLIEARAEEPDSATLTLQLNARFLDLPAAARQGWAERWQQRAASLGYTHLSLVDRDGRLQGREAQVGSGMILFQPGDGRGDAADAGGSPARVRQGHRRDGVLRNSAEGA
ncbi:MAG: hypothetical protein VKN56_00335 [Cyanobacteriota bacterium]|nr:hypothetical protein [Cyanobacteriota bacterium]